MYVHTIYITALHSVTKSYVYQMNELAMSIIILTVVKNFEAFGLILAVAVCYSSIKHHKLRRRVELKNRKRLEILKDQYINFLLALYYHVYGNHIMVFIRYSYAILKF